MYTILLLILLLPASFSSDHLICLDDEEIECYNCKHSAYNMTDLKLCDGGCRLKFCLPDSLWCQIEPTGDNKNEFTLVYMGNNPESNDVCFDPFMLTPQMAKELNITWAGGTSELYHFMTCHRHGKYSNISTDEIETIIHKLPNRYDNFPWLVMFSILLVAILCICSD